MEKREGDKVRDRTRGKRDGERDTDGRTDGRTGLFLPRAFYKASD